MKLAARFTFALSVVVLVALTVAIGVGAATNNIATVAGTATAGFSGYGGAATSAQLKRPYRQPPRR